MGILVGLDYSYQNIIHQLIKLIIFSKYKLGYSWENNSILYVFFIILIKSICNLQLIESRSRVNGGLIVYIQAYLSTLLINFPTYSHV